MPAKKERIHGTFPLARECKCDVCTPVRTAQQRARDKRVRDDRAAGIPITDHGLNGYSNLKCRCDVCRAAWATNVNNLKNGRASHPIPEHIHGSENGYGNYNCRCDLCKAAWSKASNARVQRRTANRKESAS